MKLLSLFFCVFINHMLFSQIWVAGDTTNYRVYEIEKTFVPNSQLSFDIDCDAIEDFNISSSGPIDMTWPWERLSFAMDTDVQVFNSNTGLVTTFASGDTISLTIENNWTEFLDFIYGTGAAGPYGQYNINDKYILFRKIDNVDTSYIPILFSNTGIQFTIHKILSQCTSQPILNILSGTNEENTWPELKLYPNPTHDLINCNVSFSEYKIYNTNGKLIDYNNEIGHEIKISHLENGIYVLFMKVKTEFVSIRFVKN